MGKALGYLAAGVLCVSVAGLVFGALLADYGQKVRR